MKPIKFSLKALAIMSTLAFSGSVIASNNMGVAVKASTLGLGGEVSYNLNDKFGVVAGLNSFNYDYDEDIDNISYDGELKLSTFGVSGRYHPWSSGFFLGCGININGNEIILDAKPASTGTFEFNGKTYTTSEIAAANVKADFKRVAPQLSIGWQSMKDEGLSIFTELGMMFSGNPDISYNVTCHPDMSAATCAQIRADVDAEKKEVEKDIDDANFNIWPVLALGLQYSF